MAPSLLAVLLPLPPRVKTPGLRLGRGDEILQGLVRAVAPDDQDVRGALEHVDLLDVERLVPGVPAQHRLQDDVGKVVARQGVAVGLGLDQFRPSHGAAAADLVADDDPFLVILLQHRLLDARRDVRLAPGVEADDVGERFARIVRRHGGCDQQQNRHRHGCRQRKALRNKRSHTRPSFGIKEFGRRLPRGLFPRKSLFIAPNSNCAPPFPDRRETAVDSVFLAI